MVPTSIGARGRRGEMRRGCILLLSSRGLQNEATKAMFVFDARCGERSDREMQLLEDPPQWSLDVNHVEQVQSFEPVSAVGARLYKTELVGATRLYQLVMVFSTHTQCAQHP